MPEGRLADTISRADWFRRQDLKELAHVLGRDHIRWVGGAVRDTLLGLDVHDIDAATTRYPDSVIQLLGKAGIRTAPTGIAHGTITALLADGPVEITTLRHDVSTDGRRATIAFTSDWGEDAARRDFTINALSVTPETGEIFDYFDGLSDLEQRKVRFIGDARQRIAEDHLRILRYFRFQARFGAAPDHEAEQACAEMAPTLKGLSRERIAMEVLGILLLPDPAPTFYRMKELGVLTVILPEVSANGLEALARLVSAECNADIACNSIRRLAALLPPSPDVARDIAARLRLSKVQRTRLICDAERQPDDRKAPRALAWKVGLDSAIDRILLQDGSVDELKDWDIPRFPLSGRDVLARGAHAGPDISRLLREAEMQWVAEGFPDKKRAETLLDQLMWDD
ncbi:MAG: CCA tRNA nucleotidyltransferase [Sphingomonadaceae bacterium]